MSSPMERIAAIRNSIRVLKSMPQSVTRDVFDAVVEKAKKKRLEIDHATDTVKARVVMLAEGIAPAWLTVREEN
jgi:acetolactate synthase small subunit